MSTTDKDLYSKVLTTLQGADDLSYVKHFYQGWRSNIAEANLPAIVVEPGTIYQKEPSVFKGLVRYNFDIIIWGLIIIANKDNQILGDDTHKGFLDIQEDIQASLRTDWTLGGLAENIAFPNIEAGYASYPVRSTKITLRIDYRRLFT